MTETAAAMSATLFLAHERALGHAAAEINRLLTQDSGLTPDECFVVCLRAAAKFLAQYDKDEWRDIIKHASELLLQHAALYKQSGDDSAYANKNSRPVSARRFWWSWR